jgi:hypothetical protein
MMSAGTATDLTASVISGKTLVTAVGADHLLVYDATDGALKKALVSDVLDNVVLTDEQAQDIVGAMFSSNTETGITATYQDGDGTVDLVLDAAQPTVTSLGTLTALTVDNMAFDGNTLTTTTADFTVDASHDIILDADGGNIKVKDAGTTFFDIQKSSSDAQILSRISDGDLVFRGNDGGSTITALTLDMSEAGAATFTSTVTASGFVGNVTGNASGTAATVTTAAQPNITSLGTLTGLTVNGDATFTGDNQNIMWDKSADSLEFADSAYLKFGSANDLQLFHNGSNSYIKDTGTGNLIISGSLINFQKSDNSEHIAKFTEDGSCALYYDDSKKFETTSGGVEVTGIIKENDIPVRSRAIAMAMVWG